MLVVRGLVLARNRFKEIDARTSFNLFRRQIHIKMERAPARVPHRHGRDEYLASRQDDAGRHDNVTDCPVFIIEVKIVYRSDIRIDRCDRVIG